MNKASRGFTIIELTVTVAIIAILLAMTLLTYAGMQSRARNSARLAEASQVRKLIDTYKVFNGTFPTGTASAGYCIGTNFPSGKCKDSASAVGSGAYAESDTTITAKLASIGTVPTNHQAISGTVGIYMVVAADGKSFTVTQVFDTEDSTICSDSGLEVAVNDASSSRMYCSHTYNY